MGLTYSDIQTVKYVIGQEIKRKNQGYNIDTKYILELESIWEKLNEYRR
jgi:hypothetical protein